jgi:uncharacterized protein (TIGR03083 family)
MTAPGGGAPVRPLGLPLGLRERVLGASWQARPAGRATPPVPRISAVTAFRRAVAALDQTLGALAVGDWHRPVLRDLDVQGLVGHLTGVEADSQRGLSGGPGVAGADHVASTRPAAARQAGRPPGRTRAEWRRAAGRTAELAGGCADPDAVIAVHGMRLPMSALLTVRAFEIWVHDNDIRQVTGLPPAVPDPSMLSLMTDLAARLLPDGAARAGLRQPVAVHLVLTGPGGGTWDVTAGTDPAAGTGEVAGTGPAAEAGQPGGPGVPGAVRIVTDAVGFCRLAASRAGPADLDLDIAGDKAQADAVLAAAAALALD